MEKNWTSFSNKSFSVFGSSSCILNDIVYVIGGIDQNNNNSESHNNVRIATFDLITMTWKSMMINTNGILNRSFHASAVVGSSIYTFGGSTILGNLDEIFEISITLEDIKCNTSKFPNLGIIGLSASKFSIPNIGERVFLYGGISSNGNYLSDIQIFEPNELLENSKLTTLQTESEIPPPRAYHSSIVCGDNKQLLIIHGGRGNSGLLNDIWILDTSPLNVSIETTPIVDPKVKGGAKSGKAVATSTPLPFWSQVIVNTSLPNRCLHSSYTKSIDKKIYLHIFGGIGEYGIYSTDFYDIEINQETGNKYIEQSINIPTEQNSTKRYGFSTTDIKENDRSVMLLVFGGIQKLNKQSLELSELIILDDNSNIAQHSKSLLPELFPQVDDSLNDLNVHIEYPSGDVYDGEILRDGDTMYKHGRGKMTYADGSIYEGDWFNDVRHGKGKFYVANGSHTYEGDFKNDEYSGEGKLITIVELNKERRIQQNTLEYIGSFESSLYNGNGILKDNLLDTIYEGEFYQGLKSGQGKLTRTSTGKNIYNGEWYMDVPCGYGTFILEGGHIYTGYMKNGLPDGEGHCRYVDGGEYSGLWKNGRRNGYGSYVGPLLDEYKGKWVGDVKSGYGVWKSARGDIYDGIWDLDLPHGNGQVTYNIGENNNNNNPTREKIYQGGWNHGKRSGNGKVTYANGISKKGSWNCTTHDIAFINDEKIEDN